MTPETHKRISKYLSLILRHEPEKLGLTLDDEGFVPLETLLTAMRHKNAWAGITAGQIRQVVRESDKQRYEIIDEKIRARYGHSVPQAVSYPEIEPPEILYHGTSPQALGAIRIEGLRAMARQYVHLSSVVEQARLVGRRHSHAPIILTVRAREAWESGVPFYLPEPRLYLSTAIPPEFLDEPVPEKK